MGNIPLDVVSGITNSTSEHTLVGSNRVILKGPGGSITIDSSGYSIALKGNVSAAGGSAGSVSSVSGTANNILPIAQKCTNPNCTSHAHNHD